MNPHTNQLSRQEIFFSFQPPVKTTYLEITVNQNPMAKEIIT